MSKIPGSYRKRDRQWAVMVKGQYYYQTVEQLGGTCKEDTTTAWRNYVAKVKGTQPKSKIDRLLAVTDNRIAMAPPEEQEELQQYRKLLAKADPNAIPDPVFWQVPPDELRLMSWDAKQARIAEYQTITGERERVASATQANSKGTLGSAIAAFLAEIRVKQAPLTHKDNYDFMTQLQEAKVLDPAAPTETVNHDTVVACFKFLQDKQFKTHTSHNKRTLIYRRFLVWGSKRGYFTLPPTYNDRLYWRESDSSHEVKEFTDEQVRKTLAALKLPYRLWALLCLNTGMTNADMAILQWSQIKDGILTRKRSKTRKKENTPTVPYPLWKQTIEALDEWAGKRKREGLIFLTDEGTPMLRQYYNDEGKVTAIDNFRLRWKRNVKSAIPLAKFRSIGATGIDRGDYPALAGLYLGRVPQGMDDRHYVAMNKDRLSKAIEGMGKLILGK